MRGFKRKNNIPKVRVVNMCAKRRSIPLTIVVGMGDIIRRPLPTPAIVIAFPKKEKPKVNRRPIGKPNNEILNLMKDV